MMLAPAGFVAAIERAECACTLSEGKRPSIAAYLASQYVTSVAQFAFPSIELDHTPERLVAAHATVLRKTPLAGTMINSDDARSWAEGG
jgi:isochorismate synthase EntC